MKNLLRSSAVLAALTVLPCLPASSVAAHARTAGATALQPASESLGQWIVDRADNICGLDDPKMLSKPAKVDYDVLLKATAEMKKIRDDKIDPNSSEGIQLRQKAVDKVREKAESVRMANGYCSVWKSVRHSDARSIPDITEQIKALF